MNHPTSNRTGQPRTPRITPLIIAALKGTLTPGIRPTISTTKIRPPLIELRTKRTNHNRPTVATDAQPVVDLPGGIGGRLRGERRRDRRRTLRL
jgi:hypothetical protein